MYKYLFAFSNFMLRYIVILLGSRWGGCRVLLKLEVLVHHCIHTLGINLHLSLVSLAVEDDDFDRVEGIIYLDRKDSYFGEFAFWKYL